jgi:hypothetical protein
MKRSAYLQRKHKSAGLWSNALRLLIAAAILHLAVTAVVFTLGRQALLPGTFDANGIAVSFANDGVGHREDAAKLGEILWSGRFHEWFSAAYPFHVKLYSICFAFFGAFLGFNILSAEPLNLFCCLGILILVYKIGNEIFGSRAALIASSMVALWPSFALHTTQLLKDPLFILGMLALIFIMMCLLMRPCSWRKSLLHQQPLVLEWTHLCLGRLGRRLEVSLQMIARLLSGPLHKLFHKLKTLHPCATLDDK